MSFAADEGLASLATRVPLSVGGFIRLIDAGAALARGDDGLLADMAMRRSSRDDLFGLLVELVRFFAAVPSSLLTCCAGGGGGGGFDVGVRSRCQVGAAAVARILHARDGPRRLSMANRRPDLSARQWRIGHIRHGR